MNAALPSRVRDFVFYEKENIVCLGLQNGTILIFRLLIESSNVAPQ
jgi:hypothetical protein